MRSGVWRGFPRWRSDGEDAAFNGVSTGTVHPAVDELLMALVAEPRPHELDGLDEPRAAYRATFAAPQLVPATTRRAFVHTGLLSARAAAAAGGVALGLAATAMAVAVNLPANNADRTPVSPAATTSDPQPTEKGPGVGPDATGPAAHGLCTAWSNHQRNGDDAPMDTPPMRNLAEAAGGQGKIAAYCSAVPHPGKGHGTDKPGKGPVKDKATKDQGQSEKGSGAETEPSKKQKPVATPTVTPSPSSSPSSPPPTRAPASPTPTSTTTP